MILFLTRKKFKRAKMLSEVVLDVWGSALVINSTESSWPMHLHKVYAIEPMSVGRFLIFGLRTTACRLYCFYSANMKADCSTGLQSVV
jgi:hypothetical protein